MARLSSTARVVRLAVAAGCVGLAVAAAPSGAATPHGRTFTAPYEIGASGGDAWSYHSASKNGAVTVARVYPVPGAINCTKGGPYAKLLVPFRATHPVRKVVATFDTAAVDPFTFVQVGLRSPGAYAPHWYGLKTVRGAVTGSGTITLKPYMPEGPFPRQLVVEFGLEQSSACPNADEGTIHFSSITVS